MTRCDLFGKYVLLTCNRVDHEAEDEISARMTCDVAKAFVGMLWQLPLESELRDAHRTLKRGEQASFLLRKVG